MLSRRRFVSLAALAGARTAAASRRGAVGVLSAGGAQVKVRGTGKVLGSMPPDFMGLSYEMPQMYNPRFFSAGNVQLVEAFRGLSTQGVLRLGGNLSDVSMWRGEGGDFASEKQTAAVEHGKTYWEWKLTDTSVREHKDGAITPEAIRELGTFLRATGWRLLYGLNFGCGSPERAADEAACVHREVGERLLAFQVGNESDFFGGNAYFRQKPFGFAEYAEGYRAYVSAVRARVPGAVFAGPDTATNMGWVEEYAKLQAADPGIGPARLLSSHYYAMGPAKDPAMDAERLLSVHTRLDEQVEAAHKARAAAAGLAFRMTEGNSCFGGGKPGVSDALASALWVADYMLYVAARGYAGVNLHGGGDGYYTPIESVDAMVATPRPMYAGMQLAQHFAGCDLLECVLDTQANVTAYLGRAKAGADAPRARESTAGAIKLAIINKSKAVVRAQLQEGLPAARANEEWLLAGPAIGATSGVSLMRVAAGSRGTTDVDAYSARLWSWRV